MSKLEQLIKEYCPNGVPYKTLGELGTFYGGLSGKSKEDFKGGNDKFITYMNVYSNPALKLDVTDTVRISEGEKQNIVQYGDVVFTGSSETPDECGISSVLTQHTSEKLYLNSFCMGYRLNDLTIFTPDFLKHLFRSSNLREQIKKTASGVTRFNVSKDKMKKVVIPVPPLPVQNEIVSILDNFTELTAELTAELTTELTARKIQYTYFRNRLMTFDDTIPVYQLGEVCSVQSGGTPSKKNDHYWQYGTIKWLGSTVCKDKKTVDEITNYITEQGLLKSSAKLMKTETTLIALVGATIGKVAFLPFEATINQNIAGVYPIDTKRLDPSFVYYSCQMLYPKFATLTQGAKLAMANLSFVRRLTIPVPPIDEQKRIVSILDRLDLFCNNISEGLPAEIEGRKKQYEYYRDKILTFKEKVN